MIPIQQLPKSPTRKCFEEAFLELYAQKPLDQISVMALTEKAGYSRATFTATITASAMFLSLSKKKIPALQPAKPLFRA